MQQFSRRFVSRDADLGSWDVIERYFDKLEQASPGGALEWERWLIDWSELAAGINEVGCDREVKMTCQTDDPQRERAFLEFVEQVKPKCEPAWHRLRRKLVTGPARGMLDPRRYGVLLRNSTNRVDLFRDENVPLYTEADVTHQRYQKICGAMTVVFEGQERTLDQMNKYLEETDRGLRRRAWEAIVQRRLQDKEVIEDIYDKLVCLREKLARNAGMKDYRDYAFREKERFDYSPDDCLRFHEAIEQTVVPLVKQLQVERAGSLGVDPLRPWDTSVDPLGQPPLHPFQTAEELCGKASAIFQELDPELGGQFDAMVRAGWLDLTSRKGKAPGGYQATYDEARHPFIFMNAVGVEGDVRTLLHEAGHAFHCMACREEPLLEYRNYPIEFAEVASMSMELLTMDHWTHFYQGDDLQRAKRRQLENILRLLPWVATIDAFQHWIYTHPGHTRLERTREWLRLHERFGGVVDWSGHEEALEKAWQRQLHLFGVPFYYVEYGIAQLGALQVWRNSRIDKTGAVRKYRDALSLGGSRPLPELFAAAGIKFDFSADTLGPLMDLIGQELAALRS